jgi:signal transduction histidine kinase
MLGHELRNPLSAISSASSLIGMAGANSDTVTRAKQIIQRQSQHLSRIVDDLLDLSRAMSGKILLARKPTDLSSLVAGCLETFRATGRTASYRFSVDLAPGWVDGDPTRLEQITANLLDNAIKYTPAGGTYSTSSSRERSRSTVPRAASASACRWYAVWSSCTAAASAPIAKAAAAAAPS